MAKKVGRKTVLTYPLIRQVEETISRVGTLVGTASCLCIPISSLKRWKALGESLEHRLNDDEDIALSDYESKALQLWYAIKKGQGELRGKCCDDIKKDKMWQAKAWLLERIFPDEYGSGAKEIRELQKFVKELQDRVGNLKPNS